MRSAQSSAAADNQAQNPLKAYAVLENDENTGAIYFARHAITARKAGANEYGDGELSYVRCNRAPYADKFAENGDVPASVMVENGWHFECGACGRRIDRCLNEAWEYESSLNDTARDLVRARARYKHWTPEHVIGSQRSIVFCDARCEADHAEDQRERKAAEMRVLERCKHIVLRRLPDALITDDGHHVYVSRNKAGNYRARQVRIAFDFPGRQIGLANWGFEIGAYRDGRAHFSCCNGDREVFEAWAAEQKAKREDRA